MPESNDRARARELSQLRRDLSTGASADGYRDKEGGVSRAQPGDEDAPWVKAPPFPSDVSQWLTVDPLPVDDYVFTTPIDVANKRVFNVWVDFLSAAGEGVSQLSLVPQVFNDFAAVDGAPIDAFWNTIVLDPTITVVDLSATVLGLPEAGSRTFHPAELRSAALAGGARWRVVVPFDVTMWSRFRLAVGAVDGAGSVILGYSFAD